MHLCYVLLLFPHCCCHVFYNWFGFFSCFFFLLNYLCHLDLFLDFPVSTIITWSLPSRILIYVCYCSLCFFLRFKAYEGFAVVGVYFISNFLSFNSSILFHYIYHVFFSYFSSFLICDICFVHVLNKCSLESHAWHFFPLLAPLLMLFSASACSLWCSLQWSSSFLWFESVSLCCFYSLGLYSFDLILFCYISFRFIQCFSYFDSLILYFKVSYSSITFSSFCTFPDF